MTQASGGAARHYAEAAYQVAAEHREVKAWQDALERLAAIFTDAEVDRAFANPRLDDGQRVGLALALAGDDLSARIGNFLKLVVLARRTGLMGEIRGEFETLVDAAEGRLELEVTLPLEPSAADRQAIARELSAQAGREVKVNVNVDPAIIGGLVIRRGDHVIDGSVRRRLSEMREELLAR